jgi:hypothetical protein
MDRCPICRATLNGADTCRRCRAELGSVIGVERQARRLLGDRDDAGRLLRRSLLLHRTREALMIERLHERVSETVGDAQTPEPPVC